MHGAADVEPMAAARDGALRKLAAIMTDEDFPRHAWETGRAFGTALVIALVGGLVIGLMLGAHRLSGDVAEPILVALYSIPKITLYPVILLLFGLGISAKIAFGVIHGIIPVAVVPPPVRYGRTGPNWTAGVGRGRAARRDAHRKASAPPV